MRSNEGWEHVVTVLAKAQKVRSVASGTSERSSRPAFFVDRMYICFSVNACAPPAPCFLVPRFPRCGCHMPGRLGSGKPYKYFFDGIYYYYSVVVLFDVFFFPG